jgi:hypothetical protein
MLTTRLRLVLIATTLVLAAYAASSGWLGAGGLVVGAALLGYGHVRYGTVWLAFRRMRREDFEGMARLLDEVRRPDLLAPGHRSYYELMRGWAALAGERDEEAVTHLSATRSLPLRTRRVRALAEYLLAVALIETKATPEAIDEALARARSHEPVREVAVQIAALDLGRALDAVAAMPGVLAVAGVTEDGQLSMKRGAGSEALPERLADVFRGIELPADAARRLSSGACVVAPLGDERGVVALRLFATLRGFLLLVTDRTEAEALAITEGREASGVDMRVAEIEALEPNSAPLDEAAIVSLLEGPPEATTPRPS